MMLLLISSLGANTAAQETALAEPLANVSYAQVIAQPYRDHNQQLTYGNREFQFARGWLPGKAPVGLMIVVHGGCWLNQFDLDHTRALATELATQGFATWLLEYRRVGDPGGGWPGSLQDVQAGINAVLQTAPSLPAVLAGHSAGGHLALLAAQDTHVDGTGQIKGVIGLAAITDIARYAEGQNSCQQAARAFMGGSPATLPQAYTAASVRKSPFNTHLLHGNLDTIVPAEQAEVHGLTNKIVNGAGHFDWIHTETAAFDTFMHTVTELLQP